MHLETSNIYYKYVVRDFLTRTKELYNNAFERIVFYCIICVHALKKFMLFS